jgi:vacuolar-type H+-ATPase subunit H|tara:strand:+ start:847 stop:1035 length:189 start_codon:yes stop_codon:yes gene_type:complete
MTYEELQDKVSDILDKAETEMNDIIEKFNENLDENDDESIEVDTVDLSGKFSELRDYVEDYS